MKIKPPDNYIGWFSPFELTPWFWGKWEDDYKYCIVTTIIILGFTWSIVKYKIIEELKYGNELLPKNKYLH